MIPKTEASAFFPGGIGTDGTVNSGATIRQVAFLQFAAAMTASEQWHIMDTPDDVICIEAIRTIMNSAERLTDAAMERLGLGR